MTKAVIIFFICLGVYLLGLIGFFVYKKIKAKRNFNKRLKEEEQNKGQEDVDNESNK